jgi:Tol biopolymer transport system component
MTLNPGTHLGTFEIVGLLGSGGMGEVFRARDMKLGRDVALKILPQTFASQPDRLARFRREAQVLAALNHTNIAGIFGLEESAGTIALVLELVDGPTLAGRLRKGPIPVDEALPIAKQIAEALEAAHEKGIIHRDLKPANIKVTHDGKVKVLDFGLAKIFTEETANPALSQSPTMLSAASMPGMILGTAAYMSPEQARGKTVDRRTDIWAFGVVLFEIVTGTAPFEGETVTDVLGAIVHKEPDWGKMPPNLPVSLHRLLRRCLAKDARQRLHDIADARLEIDAALNGPPETVVPATSVSALRERRSSRLLIAAVAVGAAIVASMTTSWLMRNRPGEVPIVTHATMSLPQNVRYAAAARWTAANLTISPDGRNVVYVGIDGDKRQLYLRPLDRPEVKPIDGTVGALNPFFSPDGEWIGFFSDGKLKKTRVGGGTPLAICDTTFGFGAAWGAEDTIVFSGSLEGQGLSRVSAGGGQPQPFTKIDKGEFAHRWPTFIPGTRDVLFAISPVLSWSNSRIAIQSMDSGEHHVVLEGGTMAPQALEDRIIFARNGSLFGVAFDRSHQMVIGSPAELIQGVTMDATIAGDAQYALSPNGTLVYLPGGLKSTKRSLVWVDRHGMAQKLPVPAHGFEMPRLSPDGRQIALTIREDDADIWVLSVERNTLTRLTQENGEDESPVWTPDGKRVTYSSSRGQSRLTFWRNSDGGRPEEQLFSGTRHQHLSDWTPDGQTLLTEEADVNVRDVGDLFQGKIGEKTTQVYVHNAFNKTGARLSPDSRWLVYASDESGRYEIYVQPRNAADQRVQISADGGTEPLWARNGKELFYRHDDKMMAVDVQTGASFHAGTPHVLFEGDYGHVVWNQANYDVSPDGQRFLMVKDETQSSPDELHLVLNWRLDLQRSLGKR